MRLNLSAKKQKQLLQGPAVQARKALIKILEQLEKELFEKLWPLARTGRGLSKVKFRQTLLKKYASVLTVYCMLAMAAGEKEAGKTIKAFRKKHARKVEKITELQAPEDALVKAYQVRATVYKTWVRKKIQLWATQTTRQRFKNTLRRATKIVQEGTKRGWTRSEMRREMSRRFSDYNRYELDRVITTEGTRSLNLGIYARCQEDDLIVAYRWVVNYKGCAICDAKAKEGLIAKDDLEGDNIPPAHPNCECSIEPVFAFEPAGAEYMRRAA